MSKGRYIVLLLWVGLALPYAALKAQNYPKGYFRNPLDLPIKLSGTFGELRTNHFHSGLDIRTESKEGYKVYAIADGHVSRVKVSAYGYGLAVYIDHPNGYTSVYAHLQQFQGALADWVRAKHYEKEAFEIDLSLKPGELPVRKNDIIALSGNTGGSGGPHLHFELRNTKTEAIINPQLFGYEVPDQVAPLFSFVELVPHGKGAQINGSGNNKKMWAQKTKSGYQLVPQRIDAWGSFYVQSRVADKHDGNGFNNGIYQLILLADGDTIYHFKADAFEFNETRYANSVMDYERRMLQRESIYRCMKEPGNRVSLLPRVKNDGTLSIAPGDSLQFEIIATDFNGNASRLYWKMRGATERTFELSATVPTGERLTPDKAVNLIKDELRLSMPAWNFYDTLDLQYKRSIRPALTYSAVHSIHTPKVPVHGFYQVAIKHTGLPDSLRPYTVLVGIGLGGSRTAATGSWKGDFFEARVRTFGDFYLAVDTVLPSVVAVNHKSGKAYRAGQKLNFRIGDNLSGLDSYDVFIDGKWEYHEFDGKSATLSIPLQKSFESGNHTLDIVVKDAVGNTRNFQTNFKIL